MPQYRALKTFGHDRTKEGTVITGTILTLTKVRADELNRQNPRNPVLEPYLGPSEPREAPDNRSLPGAPKTKDEQADGANGAGEGLHEGIDPPSTKEDEGKAQAQTDGPSVRIEGARPGDGRGRRSSVLRAGRPSPKRR